MKRLAFLSFYVSSAAVVALYVHLHHEGAALALALLFGRFLLQVAPKAPGGGRGRP